MLVLLGVVVFKGIGQTWCECLEDRCVSVATYKGNMYSGLLANNRSAREVDAIHATYEVSLPYSGALTILVARSGSDNGVSLQNILGLIQPKLLRISTAAFLLTRCLLPYVVCELIGL